MPGCHPPCHAKGRRWGGWFLAFSSTKVQAGRLMRSTTLISLMIELGNHCRIRVLGSIFLLKRCGNERCCKTPRLGLVEKLSASSWLKFVVEYPASAENRAFALRATKTWGPLFFFFFFPFMHSWYEAKRSPSKGVILG